MTFVLRRLARTRHLVAFLVLGGVVSLVAAAQVGALEGHRGLSVDAEHADADTFGPIPVMDPAITIAESYDPDMCALLPSCMVVPIHVDAPAEAGPVDIVMLQLTVGWDDGTVLDGNYEVFAAPDFDNFLWDTGQTETQAAIDAGKEPPEDPDQTLVLNFAAFDTNPETGLLLLPDGDYELLVLNYFSEPMSVNVHAELIVEEFVAPFELLAPTVRPLQPAAPKAAVDPTPVPVPTTAPAAPAVTAPVVLPEIEITGDDAFAAFVDTDFQEQLKPQLTPDELVELVAQVQQIEDAQGIEPSTVSLLLAVVVAPLFFLGAAGAFLWRRSPAAISFG